MLGAFMSGLGSMANKAYMPNPQLGMASGNLMNASQPMWRDPAVALPIAAALIGGQDSRESLAYGLGAAGQAIGQRNERQRQQQQRNRTLEYLQQNHPELGAQVAAGMPVAEAWKQINAPAQKPVYKQVFGPNGQPMMAQIHPDGTYTPIGGQKAPSGMSLSVGPDGEIQLVQGPGAGVAGSKQDVKNQANALDVARSAAGEAGNLKQTTQILRQANERTGYSGPGGELVGKVLDFGEMIAPETVPGDPGSRAIMRRGGLEVALGQVSETKGAISDREMGLFMAAAPGLQTSRPGNRALLDMIDAIADRTVQRAAEMEKWVAQNGSLQGFEAAWNDYINANPVIVPTGDGSIALNTATPQQQPTADDPLGLR